VLRVRPGWWRGLRGAVRRLLGRDPRSRTRNTTQKWRTWAWVGLASAAVFALGVIGFTHYQESRGVLDPIASRIYAALRLFALGGGSVAGPVPWELELARFAGPAVAAYAVLQALAALFREQIDAVRLQLTSGQLIVAGLGHKGRLVAQALLEAGRIVVVIEADARNTALRAIRESGALVVVGDARSPDVLRRAGLDRAAQLVVLCGADVVNAEIIAAARELAAGRRSGSLHCVAHLVDAELCLLFTGEELERYGRAPIRVDFVNVYAAGAQALLKAHPLFPEGRGAASRVAIIGAGAAAQHLIVGVARACSTGLTAAGPRLPVTIGDADQAALSKLADQHPEIARFLDLQPAVDPAPALALSPPEVVYVCPDDDTAAISTTLRLRSLLAGRPTRIVAVIAHRAGLARLLDGAPQPAGGPSVATFGLLDEACQPDLLLVGTTELLARALHQAYLDSTAGAGAAGDPVAQGTAAERRPWAELPERLRESNRDQAAHVAVKLAAIGDVIGPLVDWDRAQQPFSPEEVETMARLEHDRWTAERRRAGWRPGPRDSELQTTPFLVPWDELSEEIRDRDRLFIHQLPRLLASLGLQALPRDPAAGRVPVAVPRTRSTRTRLEAVEVAHDTARR
jgi:TrkA-N domain/RyR domain